MTLSPLPAPPPRVAYALTVPQSVLFADLSLRGSSRAAFEAVFSRPFEIGWVAIDDGAMSWDFVGDEAFAEALCGTTDVATSVRRFIAAMSSTARAVEKTSALVAASAVRRPDNRDDLLADLEEYWAAYERHMTSLFTFWNVEQLLSERLVKACAAAGLDDTVNAQLQRFLQPSETNYFSIERRHLARIGARFGSTEGDAALEAALTEHVSAFGFLLAPFNLGSPPSPSSVIERLRDGEILAGTTTAPPMLDGRPDQLHDVSEPLRELGLLAQELTFWKTERLDVLSLGDARAADMYRSAAGILGIGLDRLFAMRRDEIAASLRAGAAAVDERQLDERLAGFCLLLDAQQIKFFKPSRQPLADNAPHSTDGRIVGIAASPGVATGTARIIRELADLAHLQPGDVLVTTMTRPEMGAGLDRAAAFVTDQGGLMSHAAIISREMRKPCVIGTEVATRELHDGARIVVDGDNGVVTVVADTGEFGSAS